VSGKGDKTGTVIQVKLIRAGKEIRSYKIRSDMLTIGSGKACTIRTGGDPEVAEKHAIICVDEKDGALTVVSEPGAAIYLNDELVDFAVPAPQDIIKIGRLALQVELVRSMDSPPPPTGSRASKPPRVTHISVPPEATFPSEALPPPPDPMRPSRHPVSLPRPSSPPSPRIPATRPSAAPRPTEDEELSEEKTLPRLDLPGKTTATSQRPIDDAGGPASAIASGAYDERDVAYYFGENEDEERFEAPFDLAKQLLSTKSTPASKGPKEPYCAAHVLRAVDGHVKEAFGITPKRPYSAVDKEVGCRLSVERSGGGSSMYDCVLLETGHGVTGQLSLEGKVHDLQSLTVIGGVQTIVLKEGDHANLQGAGGDYKIEVYRPPLASRDVPPEAPLFSYLSLVLPLSVALHLAAAIGLMFVDIERLAPARMPAALVAEVMLDQERKEAAGTIAERAPKVTQKDIERVEKIPEVAISISEAAVEGGLRHADVLAAVEARMSTIEACYPRKPSATATTGGGEIALDWTVSTTGKVTDIAVKRSMVEPPGLSDCVVAEIKKWQFQNPTGEPARVTLAFSFKRVK
jgi:hypothetical protein